MISFTVDSAQYHGSSSLARTAAGLERVFFAEPFVRVKAITRQVVVSDGSAEHAGVSGKVCVGSDRIYYAEPFVFVRKIERKFFIKEVSSESIAPSKGTCDGVDKLYRQTQVFGGAAPTIINLPPPPPPPPPTPLADVNIIGGSPGIVYGASFYGAGASLAAGSGGGSYLGDMDLTPYVEALGDLKTAYASVSSTNSTAYKTATVALDAARDTAMGTFRTTMGFLDEAGKEHVGRIYSGAGAYPRAVRIYEYHSGELVDTSYPDETGLFSFSGLTVGKYYLTAHDFGKLYANKNPIIKTIEIK